MSTRHCSSDYIYLSCICSRNSSSIRSSEPITRQTICLLQLWLYIYLVFAKVTTHIQLWLHMYLVSVLKSYYSYDKICILYPSLEPIKDLVTFVPFFSVYTIYIHTAPWLHISVLPQFQQKYIFSFTDGFITLIG